MTSLSYLLAANVSGASKVPEETLTSVSRFVSYIIDRLPNWITAAILLISSLALARIAKAIVVSKVSDKVDEEHQEVTVLAGRATFAGVLTTGITISLAIAGVDLTAILAAVGFGISFALQDLIMNFVAGVMILMARQFSIGDFIQVGSTFGQVEEIQSRYTRLKTLDGTRVIVPNRDLFSNQVTSVTSNPFRRIDVPIGVDYSSPLEKVIKVCMEVMDTHPQILKEPKFNVLFDKFAGSSINLNVRFWVDSKSNWLQTKSEIIIMLKEAFDKAGIMIPFPIRTIYYGDNQIQEKKLCDAIQSAQNKAAPSVLVGETVSGTQVQIPPNAPSQQPPFTATEESAETKPATSQTSESEKQTPAKDDADETGAEFLK